MKSNIITAAVVAVAAFTSVAASADTFNPYLFDQMKAPATKTRAEVKAEFLQAQREGTTASSSFIGATGQQTAGLPRAEKAGTAPQAAAASEKTSQH
jgi:hypothetical protein